ncbi:MAG: DUF3604 domain-containing protein [Gammaproteobacteria bacterium]|nr:DUF3604 domain-containing protein [Gammaproteobacteria bacterium]
MKRLLSLAKMIAWSLLAILLLLAAAGFWLRYEFARVSSETLEPFDWRTVEVASLFPDREAADSCAEQHPHKRAWFGALHVHTAASYDATSFGSTVTADQAYAFARGEPLAIALRGDPPDFEAPTVRISSPLDFMAVTDHAESLGEAQLCYDPRVHAYDALVCKLYRGDVRLPVEERLQPIMRLVSFAIFGTQRSMRICGEDGSRCRLRAANVWKDSQRSTQQWQDASAACEFTTFHAYEYTLAEDSSNLHRNVIFKNDTVPQNLLSAKEAPTPQQLWEWLDATCIEGNPTCDVLAIPHNSNWSSGRMWFPYSNLDLPLAEQQRLATLRARLEPLAEINQVKGDSECRNGIASVIGAPDEHCDFEKLRPPREAIQDCGESQGSQGMLLSGCVSRYSYVRYALTAGLAEHDKLGINPFKLGIVAATDTHNGTPAAGLESTPTGSHGYDRTRENRLLGEIDVPGKVAKGSPVRYNPGGIAGVYAHENSRAALFDAMRNRETFGTSGPRITPRFFAGWQLPEDICSQSDYLATAYEKGVPMGRDLNVPPANWTTSPVFLASAAADARNGSNLLQRLQIVKGWIDAHGQTHQAVYDVAGDPNNGASVDPATCATSGPGFRQLCTTWRDPDFDPATAAVYYLRVLENPSCRWSAHDCLAIEPSQRPASCSDADIPWAIQERAWTSPIWFHPQF